MHNYSFDTYYKLSQTEDHDFLKIIVTLLTAKSPAYLYESSSTSATLLYFESQ